MRWWICQRQPMAAIGAMMFMMIGMDADDIVEGHLARRLLLSPSRRLHRGEGAHSVVPEPEFAAVRYERERIAAHRNRLSLLSARLMFSCCQPIIAGQDWQEVSNGETRARFHRICHAEWRAEQEAAARRALGLGG